MPMSQVRLKPGVNVELTEVQNEAGYSYSALVRFRAQLVEKLRGWVKFYPFSVTGIPRALHAWRDLAGSSHLAVGGTGSGGELALITAGALADITPQTLTSNVASVSTSFATTSGSAIVTVTDANLSGITVYDVVQLRVPVAVGGVVLSGTYPINSVLSATSYTIVAATNATSTTSTTATVPLFGLTSGTATVLVTIPAHDMSVGYKVNLAVGTAAGGTIIGGDTYDVVTVPSVDTFTITNATASNATLTTNMNGGTAILVYYVTNAPLAASAGYSVGTYSSGAYSIGVPVSSGAGTPITPTDWSLDNWGSTLIACPQSGALYYYTPGSGFQTATPIKNAPIKNAGAFVSTQAQILVAYGATRRLDIGEEQDPLLIMWSDQLDYAFWTPGTINPTTGVTSQAGDFRIPTGSQIVGALAAPRQDLIWTDLDLWVMNYANVTLVYGFNKVAGGTGLIAKHAAVALGANVFWMGQSNFYVYGSGGAQIIPCTVWDAVFQDLNTATDSTVDRPYTWKCWAWANTVGNEVWFFYPRASTSATECDAYVKYNLIEGTWDTGPLPRSCGIDQSVLGKPIAASPSNVIYLHETGADADGLPINAVMETGWWKLSEGSDVIFVDWVLPDFKWGTYDGAQTASITVTLYSVMYAGDTPRSYGPYTVTQATQYVNTRVRGRFMKMRVESTDTGSWWRIGGILYRGAPAGRR